MPVYEYQCPQCKSTIEINQSIKDMPLTKYPCHICWVDDVTSFMRRIISRSSFVLKGGGWYKDQYSSAKPKRKEE
jgi:putative FmdB family regulatory protein